MQYRRSDYDVTNTVQVSSVAAVRRAVEELYTQTWPGVPTERLAVAFADFERLFNGQFPGYLGCDTVYHDVQHTLDDTLAMARLLAGYERSHSPDQRLGADRGLLGIVVALFHDAGYIRQTDDTVHRNGAEFTRPPDRWSNSAAISCNRSLPSAARSTRSNKDPSSSSAATSAPKLGRSTSISPPTAMLASPR